MAEALEYRGRLDGEGDGDEGESRGRGGGGVLHSEQTLAFSFQLNKKEDTSIWFKRYAFFLFGREKAGKAFLRQFLETEMSDLNLDGRPIPVYDLGEELENIGLLNLERFSSALFIHVIDLSRWDFFKT